MAGHELSLGPADRAPPGDRRAEDRGLGELGAIVGTREGIFADDLNRVGEQVGPHPRDRLAHIRRLAALAWEQNRCGHRGEANPGACRPVTPGAQISPARGAYGGCRLASLALSTVWVPERE